MSPRKGAALAFVGYIGSIVIANWMTATFGLVGIGFGLAVTAGTFAAGAALILRDAVQVNAGKWAVLAAIIAGCAVSYFVSDPFIAYASAVAFLVGELVDWAVFTPMRGRSLPWAVLISSVVSAPVDTVLFLYISGFGVTWQAVLGQFIVKTALAGVVAAWLAWKARAR
jgi:uncharacterized PurR-regulated membrane protein YhhQ (DUF165 family)